MVKEKRCSLEYYHYLPDEADLTTSERLMESKFGADMTLNELKITDTVLHEAIYNILFIKKRSLINSFVVMS
jgi:hypothetical protein